MPRRKKTAQPKPILISFLSEETQSPHVLNLREKLKPAPETAGWQPSPLDKLLSQPVKEFKIAAPSAPRWHMPEWELPKLSFPSLSLPKISLPRPQWRLPEFSFHLFDWWYKIWPRWELARAGIISFIAISILLTLPLPALSAYRELRGAQQKIVDLGAEAFNRLQASQEALATKDLLQAASDLQEALDLFASTQKEINDINPAWRALFSIVPGVRQKYLNGERLMMAGANLAIAALPLVSALNNTGEANATNTVGRLLIALGQSLPKFQAVSAHLSKVNPAMLAEPQRLAFESARQKLQWLAADLEKIQPLLANLSIILGNDDPKRYLLIFQNDRELRPTGGFIGSFALLDVAKGQLRNLDLPGAGSYEMQGSLKAAVLPPPPLQLLKSRWEFQDANWFPDFPTSAKKIMWFYEKGGGPTVDGVLAFDTLFLTDLLKITGPIAMPEYNLTVDAQNFVSVTQKQVEIDYNKAENKPKQFLADLAPVLLEKLLASPENLLPLLQILQQGLIERHIQTYFIDVALENFAVEQGWGGALKENQNGDYLLAINTNIAGGKTDGAIKQTINHRAQISEDGSVINTVAITREHQGRPGDLFTDLQNVSYLRLYVPLGSRLLKADGFTYPEEELFKVPESWYKIDEDLKRIEQYQTIDEQSGTVITQEFGKTSFGNWVMVKPGQTAIVTLVYKLPFKVASASQERWKEWVERILRNQENFASYSLLAQKQAGRPADPFQSQIIFPEGWKMVWQDPAGTSEGNTVSFVGDLREDRYFGSVFQVKD